MTGRFHQDDICERNELAPIRATRPFRSPSGGTLDLSLDMLQVATDGITRAPVDDGSHECPFEASHSVAARSRKRDQIEATASGTIVGDEKAQLERRMKVVARVELLDRDGIRGACRRTGRQRIDRHMVDSDDRLEAEVDDRPVEEVFGAGRTAARVLVEIRHQRRDRDGQLATAGEESAELLGDGQGRVVIVVLTERRGAVHLIPAHQLEEHFTGNLVGLPRRGRS